MASLTPKLFYIGNAQSGNVYSAPNTAGSYSIIKSINVANTSSSPKIFDINLLPLGSSATNANVIVGNIAMSADNVFVYETSIVMPAGSSIYVSQEGTDLTFTISGVEYVV